MSRIDSSGIRLSLMLFFLIAMGHLFPAKVFAIDPEAEMGLAWLQENQDQDGYWGDKNKLRDTCAVLGAYRLLGVSGVSRSNALDYILNASIESNDYRARRTLVMQTNCYGHCGIKFVWEEDYCYNTCRKCSRMDNDQASCRRWFRK